jgi:NAD(P)-dependent dehydrogenase (short-subunit alcohol dehydrogenase family)
VRTHSVYGLAKAALLTLTESLALEFAPAITVNAVVPSQIASARTDTMPVYKEAAIAGTPLGRLVTEQEIARMVALVCSPQFDFVTGRAIVMDGGRTLPRFPRIGISEG